MNTSDSSAPERNDLPTAEIRSIAKLKGDNRTPIKHILIGTPQIQDLRRDTRCRGKHN